MRNRATNHLKKAKVRQSWNKYNLYNLSRIREPQTISRTFFQQKWSAKSLSRAYHGEMVREGQWERMFSRRLRAVVPMNALYLARNDGANESAGRGSGRDTKEDDDPTPLTPYMQMTYAPLERRLDTAIFRALFASSARQARQFVVHGAVKVNGKKMQYPGYLLNPGDMFQVDPERVMFATGAPKDPQERRAGRARKRGPNAEEAEAETEAAAKKSEEAEAKAENETEAKEEAKEENPRETLKNLLSGAKGILAGKGDALPAKRKQALRGFQATVRRVLSRSQSSTILTDSLEAQFLELKNTLSTSLKKDQPTEPSSSDPSTSAAATDAQSQSEAQPQEQPPQTEGEQPSALSEAFAKIALNDNAALPDSLSANDLEVLREALSTLRNNPIDSSKPYATPWRPRDYMSAFAFIPRYLEVNQNACAAVYLRHPVARPGRAEVPTPFSVGLSGTAFTYYLRRR